jgi:hypothetical protein
MLRKILSRRVAASSRPKQKTTNDAELELPAKLPQLPVDVILHILTFIGDHDYWHAVATLNKELYVASKQLPAPWPNDRIIFRRGYEKPFLEQIVFSSDNQYLCKVSQKNLEEGQHTSMLEINIASSNSGPCQVYNIETVYPHFSKPDQFFTDLGPPRFNEIHQAVFTISSDLKHLAVYAGDVENPIIRVYDLTPNRSQSTRPHFDPSRFIELKPDFYCCVDIQWLPYINRNYPFSFSASGKYLSTTFYTLTGHTGKEIVVWNLQDGSYTRMPLAERQETDYFEDESMFCMDECVIWKPTGCSYFRCWNFSSSGGTTYPRRDGQGYVCGDDSRTGIVAAGMGVSWWGKNRGMRVVAQNPSFSTIVAYICLGNQWTISGKDKERYTVGMIDLRTGNSRNIYTETRSANWINTKKGKSVLTWFPDGEHLAFIGRCGRKVIVLRLDFKSRTRPVIQKPSPDSIPARIISQVNKVLEREIATRNRLVHIKKPATKQYLYSFQLSSDGRAATVQLALGPPNGPPSSVPLFPADQDKDQGSLTTLMISI